MPPSSQNTHNAPSKPVVWEQRMATMNEPEKQSNGLHNAQEKDVLPCSREIKLGKAQVNTHLHRFTGKVLHNQLTQHCPFMSSPASARWSILISLEHH